MNERGLPYPWETAPVMLAVVDTRGAVIRWNPEAQRLLGVEASGDTSDPERTWSAVVPSPIERLRLLQALATDGPLTLELSGMGLGGRNLTLRVSGLERLPDGRVLALYDITRSRCEEEGLTSQAARARHLARLLKQERQLVAFDIHDGVAQTMTAALMHVDTALRCEGTPPEARSNMERAVELLRQGVGEVRALINHLAPPDLADLGLEGALLKLAQEARGEGIEVATRIDHLGGLAESIELALYRIVQEGLQNVRKHSGSNRAELVVRREREEIVALVRDWGVGFDPARVDRNRHGLRGVRRRVELLGGTLDLLPAPHEQGQGALLEVRLPVCI